MKYPREVLESYVMDDKGLVHQLVPGKIAEYIFLRRGNNYKSWVKREVKQKIVNGTWRYPNEFQLKRFIAEDNRILQDISQKILKRLLLTQMVIEVDDELLPHFEDDKVGRKHIEKSQNYFDIKNKQLFQRIYGEDEELVQNIMKAIDHFLESVSKKLPNDLYRAADLILKADQDPAIYGDTIEMTKIE